MRELLKIVCYTVVVLLSGALFAPPVFWLGQWLIENNILPQLRPFAFSKYFNRVVIVVAFLYMWPLCLSLGLTRVADLQLRANRLKYHDLLWSFVIAVVGLGLMVCCLCLFGQLTIVSMPTIFDYLSAALTAVTVACIEEIFFRGILLGILRRNLSASMALVCVTVIFALVHFVHSDNSIGRINPVLWYSGIKYVPLIFVQLTHVEQLLGLGSTLMLLGLVLGYAVLRTASLHYAIGLHAGWVFAWRLLLHRAQPLHDSPWIGNDLRIGAAAWMLMLLTWLVTRQYLHKRC